MQADIFQCKLGNIDRGRFFIRELCSPCLSQLNLFFCKLIFVQLPRSELYLLLSEFRQSLYRCSIENFVL